MRIAPGRTPHGSMRQNGHDTCARPPAQGANDQSGSSSPNALPDPATIAARWTGWDVTLRHHGHLRPKCSDVAVCRDDSNVAAVRTSRPGHHDHHAKRNV
jgi:hypothetical protein